MPHSRTRAARAPSDAPDRLRHAAAHVLATRGFGGATTRAIGEQAGCNPALVSYYFGSLNSLLLAALDESSAARLAAYEQALAAAPSRRAIMLRLRELYQADCRSGHAALLAALVAGGTMDRELGRAVGIRVQPWLDLVERTVLARTPAAVRRRLPAREIAYAAVAGFLGLELLDNLMGDQRHGDAVVDRLARLASRASAR